MFTACYKKTFQSSALVKIQSNSALISSFSLYPDTCTNILESNTAITKISEGLNFEISNSELKQSITIENIDMNDTFEITVSHTDKELSQQILNVVLEEYPLILKDYSSDLNFVIISKSTDAKSK